MLKNYLKIALRNLTKYKLHSLLNMTGLSLSIAITIIIALWITDEMSYDHYHGNYKRIAQVMQSQTLNNEVYSQVELPIPLGYYLRQNYGSDFKEVVLSTKTEKHILMTGQHKFLETGRYMGPEAPDLFTLHMLEGTGKGLNDPSSILISQTVAKALFGQTPALGRMIKLDDDKEVKIAGIYEDLPANTTLNDLFFIAPWQTMNKLQRNLHNWGNNGWCTFVELTGKTDINEVNRKISKAKYDNADNGDQRFNPVVFLQPMSKWHLYAEFKNGVNVGGRIQYIWLFGTIGFFVLLLACINFMNLSTARSEKRGKEVGIRKAIGSFRGQLIRQFYLEAALMAFISFGLALVWALALLPFFNEVSNKQISLPWRNPSFWGIGFGFTLFTALLAGSYPALYLSSFQPVKVLKGAFKAGKATTIPRRVLIICQFTISVVLIIGTIIVFKQILYAKDRPIGYSRGGLLTVEVVTPQIHDHFDAFRQDLIQTGAVENVAASSTPPTETRSGESDFDWEGKTTAGNTQNFATIGVSKEYGNTIGWQFISGRDYRTGPEGADALDFVINESAAKMMGFKDPIGQRVRWNGYTFTIIGVVKDMVMNSPFDPVDPAIFYMAPWRINVYNIKLNPLKAPETAVDEVSTVFKHYSPEEPFLYKFADEEYDRKFASEVSIGKLAGFFASFAIFISCLGLFGMASFMAEQRVKEIGIRKVLGASVINIWQMLSQDFIGMVSISLAIALPLAFWFMHQWLQHYHYRTTLSAWVFILVAVGAIVLTVATVSYQGIKAALRNPVQALRTE